MKNRNIIRFILLIVIINGVSLLSGVLNWLNQFFITGSLFFLGGVIYSKKWRIKELLYSLLLLLPFMSIYAGFVFAKGFLHVYPIALVPLVALPAGLFINRKFSAKTPSTQKYIFILSVLCIIALGAYVGMPNWQAYVFNKPAEQIQIKKDEVSGLTFITENGSTVRLGDLKGKIVVLDFWSTSCSVCFKKFPDFEKLYETFKDNGNVRIYAVNIALKNETTEEIIAKVNQPGYAFPNLFVTFKNRNEIKNIFRFNAVPTLIIIDKNGNVHYKGSLVTSRLIMTNNAYDMIQKLLKE